MQKHAGEYFGVTQIFQHPRRQRVMPSFRSWSSLLVTALVIAGCGQAPVPPVEDRTTEIKAEETKDKSADADAGIVRVAPEGWNDFVGQRSPTSRGWVALPTPSPKDQHHSSVDATALGLLKPEECADCHAGHVNGFQETAHARTMRVATPQTVLGVLTPPHNKFLTRVKDFSFETVARGEGVIHQLTYQHAGTPRSLEIPVAYTVGSGNHGQSFLAWYGDMLCQTPVSYMTEANRWGNSPGLYIDGTADFSRPATPRCLDCHNTWFAHAPGSVNQYDKETGILGVTCVRCHGAARDHIQYHRRFPEDSVAQSIVNPRRLSRERANEVCAQCHSGGGDPKRPAFTYQPGEPLEQWLDINLDASDTSNDDPHSANQLGRLMRSRCYLESGTLTCMDCHNPHLQERGQADKFSKRCQSCHQVDDCGLSGKYAGMLATRCIECHMPSRRDRDVASQGASESLLPLLRDHQIGIWPDVSNAIEQQWKSNPR